MIQVVHLIDWTTLPVSHIETPVFFELPVQRIKEPHKLSLLAGQFTVIHCIGICMHISTNLFIVANHIDWVVPEVTCIEEVHSLAHDVCADKHNSIVSSVIILRCTYHSLLQSYIMYWRYHLRDSWSNVITSWLHMSLIFNVSVTPNYSARVSVRVNCNRVWYTFPEHKRVQNGNKENKTIWIVKS